MKSTNPFKVEELRSKLAKEKKFDLLKETYSSKFPEIKNSNTPTLWDRLNFEKFDIKTQNPMMWDRLNIVAKIIPKGVKKVLDIGFGGAQLEDLVINTFSWFGIDISPKSVKNATTKYPDKDFQLGTITNIGFPKNSFDCAIALEVLEHIPPHQILTALSEVIQVLKLNGFFIVSVPLNEDLESMIKIGSNPNAHVRIYSPELVKVELEVSGFKILSSQYLYAFHEYYYPKKILVNLFPFLRHPNNIIILAQKA